MSGSSPLDDAAVAAPATEPEAQPAPIAEPAEERVSLVIQTSFLGDTVLTTPLIAELARRGPVDVVVTPASAPVLRNNPAIRHLIVYDKRGDARGMTGLWRASRTLASRHPPGRTQRDERCVDVAYLAQGSIRSAMLALLAGIRERVGFATSAGRRLYTRVVPYRDDLHHAERLLALAAEGAESASPPSIPSTHVRSGDAKVAAAPVTVRPRLYPGDEEAAAVEVLLAEHGWDGEPMLALAPGSVWETKRWPYYPELARRLSGKWRIVVIGGPRDGEETAAIVEALGDAQRPIVATGKLTLLGSAELLSRVAALVTNDSAPLHLASAVGTPTVAVFGPTVPEFGFGPLAPRREVAGHGELPCRPCDRHGPRRCPLSHWRCMRDLSPESIERLVERVVSTPTS